MEPTTTPQQQQADDGSNNNRHEDEDMKQKQVDVGTSTSTTRMSQSTNPNVLPVPAAPMKQKLRKRRKQLIDGIRTKREQLRRTPKPITLVEDYYRVDTTTTITPSSATTANRTATTTKQQQQQQPTTTTTTGEAATKVGSSSSKKKAVVLPGVLRYENDWARDSHDFFNLVVLVPITALNLMNWNWDMILLHQQKKHNAGSSNSGGGMGGTIEMALSVLSQAWTGDWFYIFFNVVAGYFIFDLLWILVLPHCVKSPMTILQHHVAVLLYICIPFYYEPVRWCMGACMWVEINTWFLIARRVFNKQGFPPWTISFSFFSVRVKVISILFYVTWISIRCILYPMLLVPFYYEWRALSAEKHTIFNVLFPAVPLHACFCLLNIKWTYELWMSKIRYFRRKRRMRRNSGLAANNNNNEYYSSVSKGL